MKQNERTGIMRILSDMISADEIIDTREIMFLHSLKERYNIKKDDELRSVSMTLQQAVNILRKSSVSMVRDLLGDLTNVAMSDDYCSRSEALLLLSLMTTLGNRFGTDAEIVSLDASGMNVSDAQMLYVESSYDERTNEIIREHYRELYAETQLTGFDFVYVPKVAEHYRSLQSEALEKMISFLYPRVSEERLACVIHKIQSLSTADFCKYQLSAKMNIEELFDVQPSLFIKLADSDVNNKRYANFLILGLDKEVLPTIRQFIDAFSRLYRNRILNYLREEKGRFVFSGFYRQLLDLHLLQKGIRSTVLVDTVSGDICFPEADVKVEKLHRREKALYALFLIESSSGGVNFDKPKNASQLKRYEKRIKALQEKYGLIYKEFGGDKENAPNLEIPEIRLPMISLIKRQISKLGETLHHVDDYLIQRNVYGNYGVRVELGSCFCRTFTEPEPVRLEEAESWQRIMAL